MRFRQIWFQHFANIREIKLKSNSSTGTRTIFLVTKFGKDVIELNKLARMRGFESRMRIY